MSTYLVEIRGPLQVLIGVDAVASVRVEGPTGYVAPSAATVTVYNGSTEAAAAAADTIAGDGTVTFTVADSVTTGQAASTAWWLLWTITVGGEVVRQTQRIRLASFQLACPVTTAMLLDLEPTFVDGLPEGQSTWYPQIAAAWTWVLGRLVAEEYEPDRIRNSDGLVQTTLMKALSIVAALQATYVPDGGGYDRKAVSYAEMAETEWDRKRLDTDTDDDGDVDVEHAPAPNPSADTAALRQQWFGG